MFRVLQKYIAVFKQVDSNRVVEEHQTPCQLQESSITQEVLDRWQRIHREGLQSVYRSVQRMCLRSDRLGVTLDRYSELLDKQTDAIDDLAQALDYLSKTLQVPTEDLRAR